MIADTTQYWLDSRPAIDRASNGDFAECFQIGLHRHAVVVGDVAGHGLAAGVAAAVLSSFARRALASPDPLRTSLARIDRFFSEALASDTVPLASLFLAVCDAEDRVLEYASAGHEPGLHFSTATRHEHLDPTGPLLGLGGLARTAFSQRRVHFAPDSMVVIVTDGITEARRCEGGRQRFFGSAGVARAFAEARRTQRNPAESIGDAARAYAGRALADDATALVVRPRVA